jgi:hypothetical protein
MKNINAGIWHKLVFIKHPVIGIEKKLQMGSKKHWHHWIDRRDGKTFKTLIKCKQHKNITLNWKIYINTFLDYIHRSYFGLATCKNADVKDLKQKNVPRTFSFYLCLLKPPQIYCYCNADTAEPLTNSSTHPVQACSHAFALQVYFPIQFHAHGYRCDNVSCKLRGQTHRNLFPIHIAVKVSFSISLKTKMWFQVNNIVVRNCSYFSSWLKLIAYS